MIRSTLKRGIKKILGMDTEPTPVPKAPPAPEWKMDARPQPKPEPVQEAPKPVEVKPVEVKPEVKPAEVKPAEPVRAEVKPVKPVEAAPAVAEAPAEKAAEKPAVDPTDDTAGRMLTMEAVQEIMDEMVRPALQGDGGDISLIKVENNDIFVKLVGSCSTCPSSIMTMKMGVEALLKEEFPMMGSLVQVD